MKILFIASWYPTKKNPNFGIFIKEHAHAIHISDNEIIVLALVVHRSKELWSKTISDNFDENGVRTVLIEINTRFRDIVYHAVPIQYQLFKSAFKKYIQPGFTPEIIHSNVIFPAGIIGNWLAKYLKKPHIITEHWSKISSLLQKPYLSQLAKKSYKNAVKILPVSEFLKNNIKGLFPTLKDDKFVVISNVINSNIFTYKEKQKKKNEITLCAIATWATKKQPDKKPEFFIDAISIIQKRIPKSIKLIMVGGGERVENLKLYCKLKNVNVEFVGYQTKKNIASILHNSDFLIHASLIETFGVVIVEALMTGTPVICSRVGALPEIITKSNGILCENTVESWVNGIMDAINQSFEPEEIANKIQKVYDAKSIGMQIFSVYQKLTLKSD